MKKRLVHLVAYPAFFNAAFIALFFLLFPYDALKDRLQSEARKQGIELTIDAIGPVLFGIEAQGVELHLFKSAAGKALPAPVRIQSLKLLPHLFPMGAHISAQVLGGQLDASIQATQPKRLKLRAAGLQLMHLPPEALGNLVLDGELSLLADLSLDEQDFAKTEGRLALLGTQMLLRRGSIQGFTLPRVDLGRIELDLDLAEGKTLLKTARITGVDIVTELNGDIRQARKLAPSTLNVGLRFQPSQDFLSRNPLITAALSMAAKKAHDGFYEAALKGSLGSPSFQKRTPGGR
ncbi:MAG: type II secretion system protein GspN [Myxococcales bacterium]|nr:type II secretion system protein GspN [Myxococcales bacterium]